MTSFDPRRVLEYVSSVHTKAQTIRRFEGNLYVTGDSIAEHLSRLVRLCATIAPQLREEFPTIPDLVEHILVTLLVHDDDEVIVGYDIPTTLKIHNSNDDEEIRAFGESLAGLDVSTTQYLTGLFTSFRRKDTLVAKIAKALDNISANQVVIEQKIALINPDQARFGIEYVEKVRGISKTIDALIDAQIEQIHAYRRYALEHFEELEGVPAHARDLLMIDVTTHTLDKSKINLPLDELKAMP